MALGVAIAAIVTITTSCGTDFESTVAEGELAEAERVLDERFEVESQVLGNGAAESLLVEASDPVRVLDRSTSRDVNSTSLALDGLVERSDRGLVFSEVRCKRYMAIGADPQVTRKVLVGSRLCGGEPLTLTRVKSG